jgi:hypothetical protein
VPSNAPRTQHETIADLCRVAGVSPVKVSEVPPLLLKAMGLFDLSPTPWDTVLKATVDSYGSRTGR